MTPCVPCADYLSTHPSTERRIERLKEKIRLEETAAADRAADRPAYVRLPRLKDSF